MARNSFVESVVCGLKLVCVSPGLESMTDIGLQRRAWVQERRKVGDGGGDGGGDGSGSGSDGSGGDGGGGRISGPGPAPSHTCRG